MLLKALLVFVAYVVLDVVWTVYTRAVSNGDTVYACVYSALLPLLSAGSIIAMLDAPVLILAACAGAVVGTWCGMRWTRGHDET